MSYNSIKFDVEQKILQCWNIIDDIGLITANWTEYDDSTKLTLLRAICELYEVKFDNCFKEYENLCKQK